MFKSFGQRLQNKKQKTVSLWNREFDVVSEGLDEEQVNRFVEEIMAGKNDSGAPYDVIKTLMERAVADAERIVEDIKTEAQNEALKIIDEAKYGAEEILKKEKLQIDKEADEILEMLKKGTKSSDKEAKKRVQDLLLRIKNEIENEVRKEYKETHSRLLYSLLGTTEVNLGSINITEPDVEAVPESKEKPEITIKDEIKEEAETVEEVVEEAVAEIVKEPEKVAEVEQKTKEKTKKDKEEEKKLIEEEKRAKKEAEKIEAEQLKKAQKEQKLQQKAEQPSLLARFNAFRDRLNERLSQPIGGKAINPAPRPTGATAQSAAQQVEKDEVVKQAQGNEPIVEAAREATPEEKSRELMNLIYAEEIPEIQDNPEEKGPAAEPEQLKAEEETPAEVTEDETETAEDGAETTEEEKTPVVAEKPGKEEIKEQPGEIIKQDEGIMYSGDVEMSVEVPVNLVAVSKLYNYLQSTPDLKVLYTKGSWDKATTIMISIDKPLPIIDMISRIPGINVIAKTSHSESEIKGAPASLLGTKKDEIIKISLNLSEV